MFITQLHIIVNSEKFLDVEMDFGLQPLKIVMIGTWTMGMDVIRTASLKPIMFVTLLTNSPSALLFVSIPKILLSLLSIYKKILTQIRPIYSLPFSPLAFLNGVLKKSKTY
jgi:hypothetical protein